MHVYCSSYGPTQFSDLEDHEYRAGYLGLNTGLESKPEFGTEFLLTEPSMMSGEHLGKLPELFDWRSYNAVTPVKNQGTDSEEGFLIYSKNRM